MTRYTETMRNHGWGLWLEIVLVALVVAALTPFFLSLQGPVAQGYFGVTGLIVGGAFTVFTLFSIRMTIEVQDEGISLRWAAISRWGSNSKVYWAPQILKVELETRPVFSLLPKRLFDPVNGAAYGLMGYRHGLRVFLDDGTSFFVALGDAQACKAAFDSVKAAPVKIA
ncbi:MAG: hypothetical protein IT462_11945 [Planctomycetes bacterium]|nr:hypothetical protein [Planctomycetota bacterium]